MFYQMQATCEKMCPTEFPASLSRSDLLTRHGGGGSYQVPAELANGVLQKSNPTCALGRSVLPTGYRLSIVNMVTDFYMVSKFNDSIICDVVNVNLSRILKQ